MYLYIYPRATRGDDYGKQWVRAIGGQFGAEDQCGPQCHTRRSDSQPKQILPCAQPRGPRTRSGCGSDWAPNTAHAPESHARSQSSTEDARRSQDQPSVQAPQRRLNGLRELLLERRVLLAQSRGLLAHSSELRDNGGALNEKHLTSRWNLIDGDCEKADAANSRKRTTRASSWAGDRFRFKTNRKNCYCNSVK